MKNSFKRFILFKINKMKLFKITFFTFHILFIFSNLILWYWFIEIIYLQFLVILSWAFNKNRCLITQIEAYYFNQTLIEYLNNKQINDSSKFIVPFDYRITLYLIFVISIYHHICIQIRLFMENFNGFT